MVAALAAVALIAALAGVVAAGGGVQDRTARLVPADALLYVHGSTRDADRRLWAVAGRFATPRLQLARLGMALTPGAARLDLRRDVRPWLGGEVAFALLDAGAGAPPTPLLLAAVKDRGAAARLLERLGGRPAGSYRGAPLRRLPGAPVRPLDAVPPAGSAPSPAGSAPSPAALAALAGDFLAVGAAPAVRAVLDRYRGTGAALADARVYRRAAATRRDDRAVDLYASAAGIRRLLVGRPRAARLLAGVLTAPEVGGVSAEALAEDGGVRLRARILRAPGRRAPRTFAPTLPARVPARAAAYVGLPGVDAAAGLLAGAGGAALLERLGDALTEATGLDLDRDVLGPLSGEAALSVTLDGDAPVVTLAARTRDRARTREALARLQVPLADRLGAEGPFASRMVGDVPAFSLAVTPALRPSYAVDRDLVVASTSESGLSQLRPARPALDRARALRAVVPETGAKVEALGFLDLRQLLALGERMGVTGGPGSSAVQDDLRRIRAAGAVVEEDPMHATDTTAELFLEIP